MGVLTFEIGVEGAEAWVSLRAGDDDPGLEAPFDVGLLQPTRRLGKVVGLIDEGVISREALKDVGSQLWAALLAPGLEERFEEVVAALPAGDVVQLRLVLPLELQAWPWEAIYDDRRFGFLTGDNPRFCVVRGCEATAEATPEERRSGPLSILAVVPEGSGLQARREMSNLKEAADRLEGAIHLVSFEGRVIPERLKSKLAERRWDVVHYIGHGEVAKGSARIRVNDEAAAAEERWMEGEVFASLFRDHPPRLVVLNCCLGAVSPGAPTRSLSGIAPFLLRAGVPAVVAMRYEIDDDDAVAFSRSFYRELLTGTRRGRVDLAVVDARRHLFIHQRDDAVRSFVTPVLFVAPGGETISGLAGVAPRETVPIPTSRPRLELPAELGEAVAEGRCIPVIGAGLLGAGARRSERPPPGPHHLIRMIVRQVSYPIEEECAAIDRLADHDADLMLQRVCQHVQFVNRASAWRLFDWLRAAYRDAAPPAVFGALASWPSPGWIYTFYDGFLADAVQRTAQRDGRRVRVLNRVDQQQDAGEACSLVINLRGSVEHPDSLVLTEQEHEAMHERMRVLNPAIGDLVHKAIGRSLLLLGVSPRDPTVRLLINRLLPEGRTERCRTLGPLFFVAPEHSRVDDAYWSRFGTEWIEAEPAAVIAAVTPALEASA